MSRQILPRVFSGIQPTGSLHLGNYFGAVKRWVQGLQDNAENLGQDQRIFSIVDLHAITMPQQPEVLQANVLAMTADLISCGLDPEKCILFRQSAVLEHTALSWILGCCCNMPQLAGLAQYKEKSSKLDEIPLGLFIYPVLQSADILLYKSTMVPVGEDNLQNVQVARQVCKTFNKKYGDFFPTPKPILINNEMARVKSLRDPLKKMSKSDSDWRSCIFVSDSPDVVVEKCKKAVTDFTSNVTFDPDSRPGVSNLVSIHCGFTGQSPEEVCNESRHMTTAQYKLKLAEVINEHLRPIRLEIQRLQENRGELISILDKGAEKAQTIAQETMKQVKALVGLF